MKPLNYNEPGCDFTTSNCVIWQGPDIPCLNLCKGDSVSDVVYKAGMEICHILDTLNIQNYEAALSCLDTGSCPPANFTDLINLIISQLCNLDTAVNQKVLPPGTGSSATEQTLSPCFYYKDPFGNTITKATPEDYATAMGNRICELILTIQGQQDSITDLNGRVSALESAPAPVLVLPELNPACIAPATPALPLDEFTALLETEFCNLRNATGTQVDIFENILKACNISSLPTLANPGSNYNSLVGWSSTVNNLAQSFGNLWLLACDMRAAILNIQTNCCPGGCEGITLTLTAYPGTANSLNILVNGTIPGGYFECTGNTIITLISSTGITITVTVASFFSTYLGLPYAIDLSSYGFDISDDITVSINPCLTNNTYTCESCLEYSYVGTLPCPELVAELLEDGATIQWEITTIIGAQYTVKLIDQSTMLPVASFSDYFATPGAYDGTFFVTIPGTYAVEVTVSNGPKTTTCPKSSDIVILPPPPEPLP